MERVNSDLTTNLNNITNEPRTIYSLAMVVILYELFNSEYLKGEDSLIIIIKSGLLILIIFQLIFLLLCGLSVAEFKAEHREKLLEIVNISYATGFQSSLVFFMIGLFNFITYGFFKNNEIPFNLWGKIIYFLISLLIIFGVWRMREKYFKIRPETNQFVKWIVGIWVFIIIVVLVKTG